VLLLAFPPHVRVASLKRPAVLVHFAVPISLLLVLLLVPVHAVAWVPLPLLVL
jgi:hypothetical protein